MLKTFQLYNRPISPHLLIYAPQLSSLFSIWHRITGVILASIISISLLVLKIFTISNSYFLISLNTIFFLLTYLNWIINYMYLLMLFFLVYHMLNGIRHMIWDLNLFINLKFLFFSSIVFIFVLSLILILNII